GLVFGLGMHMRPALVVDRDSHVHGPAADWAILNIALLLYRRIREDFDGLAAVGAADLKRLGLNQHATAPRITLLRSGSPSSRTLGVRSGGSSSRASFSFGS